MALDPETLGHPEHAADRAGLISEPLENLYTPAAIVLGMVYIMALFIFLPLFSEVDNPDCARIKASMGLGATRFQTFVKVAVPQTLPGMLGGPQSSLSPLSAISSCRMCWARQRG